MVTLIYTSQTNLAATSIISDIIKLEPPNIKKNCRQPIATDTILLLKATLAGVAYQKFSFSYILILIFLDRMLPLFIQVTRTMSRVRVSATVNNCGFRI
jgi:hypothetical protein